MYEQSMQVGQLSRKTSRMGLPFGDKFHNPNFNRDTPVCRTDRRTDGRTGDSIIARYAVAR